MYSLAGALFLFSVFPDSFTEGRTMGFGLGGAAGFAGFFMLSSFAWLSRTRPRDELARELRAARDENRRLRRELDTRHALEHPPVPIARSTRYEVALRGERRHRLGMITGNLVNVQGVDVWVNPENSRMEMSRITEPTVSAAIRYHGGDHDMGGHLIADTIAVELAELMADRTQVAAAQVLITGPGRLRESHGVQHIAHVAAVEGEPASGFRQVMSLGRCVHNILAELDRLNDEGAALRSVLLPLLGTGGGSSDIEKTVDRLVSGVAEYFRTHQGSRVRTVYLLAYTDAQEAVCRTALNLQLAQEPGEQQ